MPDQVARQEFGHRLVGERLRGLVVADDAVEPLMGHLVDGQVFDRAARHRRWVIQIMPGDSMLGPVGTSETERSA